MHREFRELLEDATGESQFVIAVNLDIRGFSSFSKEVESPDVAMFIKRVYMTLIDDYFPDASFFKPTGDGLLITIPYTEIDLEDVARRTIDSCRKALQKFDTFCVHDSMINFKTPKSIGIGVARGTACRLVSGSKTLDYSGRVLNLASRLMDVARPSGIVIDAAFGRELLSSKQARLFAKDSIYIKGIAESEPIDVYYTKDLTRISQLNRQPLDETKWNTFTVTKTLKELKSFAPQHIYDLSSKPIDPSEIKLKVVFPEIRGGKRVKGLFRSYNMNNFEYYLEAGKPKVKVGHHAIAELFEKWGVKDSWEVTLNIIYPVS